jgi:ubiquitin-protein ligase
MVELDYGLSSFNPVSLQIDGNVIDNEGFFDGDIIFTYDYPFSDPDVDC